jgi:hypothetical protein
MPDPEDGSVEAEVDPASITHDLVRTQGKSGLECECGRSLPSPIDIFWHGYFAGLDHGLECDEPSQHETELEAELHRPSTPTTP